MKENYNFEILDGITIVRFLKSPTLKDFKSAIDCISIDQPKLRLWNISNKVDLSINDIHEMAYYAKVKLVSPSKVAIITPYDFTNTLAQVHEIHRNDEISDRRIFHTEKKGVEWLLNNNDA